jgi:hypothetical protein
MTNFTTPISRQRRFERPFTFSCIHIIRRDSSDVAHHWRKTSNAGREAKQQAHRRPERAKFGRTQNVTRCESQGRSDREGRSCRLAAQSGGLGFKGHCSIRISLFSHPPQLSKREIMNRGLQAHSINFIPRIGLLMVFPCNLSAPLRLLIYVTVLVRDDYGVWCAL